MDQQLDQHDQTPEERMEAVEQKVEKLDRIVYRIWKDLEKAGIVKSRQAEA
jgi:hypothetical protein